MNLFFNAIHTEAQYRVFAGLIEHYNIKKAYAVNFIEAEGFMQSDTVNEFYARQDMVHARYSRYVHYDDAPPVDEKLLNSMHQYESTVMKMMECIIKNDKTPSYEDRVLMYHNHLRYWNYVLDKAEIGIAIFTNVPHSPYAYIVYGLCKIKDIPVAITHFGPIPGYRYFHSDILEPCPEVSEVYQRLIKELDGIPIDDIEIPQPELNDAFSFLALKKSSENPHRVGLSVRIQDSKSNKVLSVLKEKVEYLTSEMREHGKSQIFNVAYRWLTKKVRKIRKKSLFSIYDSLSTPADFSKQYIFFPLHYQPECTTCPMGGYFVHQYSAISMLSFYVPESVRIFVKEHPLQETNPRGRDEQLYYDLIKLPNVQLIDRKTSTDKMIENCLAVATITGSPGFEGLLREKPFLMFGSQISMYAPGTFSIRSNEDCKNAIDYIVENGAKHTLRDMKIYLKAVSEVAKRCELSGYDKLFTADSESLSPEDNAERVVNGLVQVLDKQLHN